MKILCIVILALLATIPAASQALAEKEAIMEPINNLFKGMNTGDSALVHSAFVKTVTFVTVAKDKNGKANLYPDPLDKFLAAVGTPHAQAWSEPIWNEQIQVDGIFAQVWANYAFYQGNKFSHCGVDAFHIIKGDDGRWRIFHLADTRQREGCQVPDRVKDLYK